MISLTPSRALRMPGIRPHSAAGEQPGQHHHRDQRRSPASRPGASGNRTTALAPQAPSRNWPSAPMFQSRIRNASAQARPVRISGVALTSVSEMTPMLPNAALRMWTNERDRVAADERDDRAAMSSATTSAPSVRRRRQPARDRQARLEADRHAGSPVVAATRRPSRRPIRRPPPRRRRSSAARSSSMSASSPGNDPTIRPSYITSTRSARARISSSSSEIRRIAAPLRARRAAAGGPSRSRRRRARASAGRRPAARGSVSISRARISRWRLPPDSSRACVSIDGAAIRYAP